MKKIHFDYFSWKNVGIPDFFKFLFSGKVVKGEFLEKLNSRLINTVGKREIYLVNKGRLALELGLRSLGLREGDEVIIPSYACDAIITPILKVRARPVFADIDNDLNISPDSIRGVLTGKSRAVIMAHLYGLPAKIEDISGIARDNNLFLIDDAASAFLLKVNNRYLGTFGDIGIYSFAINKTISSLERGGVLVINSEKPAIPKDISIDKSSLKSKIASITEYLILYRYPIMWKYYIAKMLHWPKKICSIESMANIDAYFIYAQMLDFEEKQAERLRILDRFHENLKGLNQIDIPQYKKGVYLTKLFIKTKEEKVTRDNNAKVIKHNPLKTYLQLRGIQTDYGYYPLHLKERYNEYYRGNLHHTESLSEHLLALPIQNKYDEEVIDYICGQIKRYYKS